MRKDGIPYVPNGAYNHPFPAVPLQDMTLEEIKNKYLTMCAKANGDPAVCSKCKTPCENGKRAVQLVANQVYNDPPVPLYGGKTLIERAKEENMRRREEAAKKAAQTPEIASPKNTEKKAKRNYTKLDGWWEESLASGDQVQWLMDKMSISKTKAKSKIYNYKWTHGMVGSAAEKKETKEETTNPVQENEKQTNEKPKFVPKENSFERKLEDLMKQQEEQKKAMDEYMKLYKETEKEYNKIKEQTDVLCRAMDILSEI